VHALITNDDGIDSAGLCALAVAARDAGYQVTVAAPAEEASGSSASITASEADAVTAAGGHGRIRVTSTRLADLDVAAFRVYAAPALIALIAAHGAFGPAPDLVLSGINRGANVGRAILHSGTVGAALTGGVNGARGLAVSLAVAHSRAHAHWTTAADVSARVFSMLEGLEPGTVLNLNVPNLPSSDGIDLVEAPLAAFGIVQTTMTEAHDEHVTLSIADPPDRFEPGTDAALLAAGAATITSIRSVTQSDVPVFS